MFLLKYSCRERFDGVVGQHLDLFLKDDLAVIEQFIDEMDRATRRFHTCLKSLPLSVKPRKCR